MSTTRRTRRASYAMVLACAAALTLLAACSASTLSAPAPTPVATRPVTPPTGAPRTAAAGSVTKVLTVVEENHSIDQMRAGMPYLASLADRFGYATSWTAVGHPSEPNYLAIAGGSTFGVTNDDGVSANGPRVGNALSVFDQALAAGSTATAYIDGMTGNCSTSSSGRAPVKHNPWVFFQSGRADCERDDVPVGDPATGRLMTDIRGDRLPAVGLVVPSLDHDAHDGSLAEADGWLRNFLEPLLASSDFTSGRLAVVVTADEDDNNTSDNRVLTVVMHRSLSHVVVSQPLTHYSLTRLYANVVGVAPLGEGASAGDLAAAFHLPIG